MQITEIVEIEKQRSNVFECRIAKMYREGTFMRAYNWSAWLWCKYIKEFKPIHRKAKQVEGTVIQIGCPIASYAGHLPEDVSQVHNDDGSVVITLPDTMIPDDSDLAAMVSEYDQWKQSFPVTEPQKKKSDVDFSDGAFAGQPATITGIMQQILAFPVEKKSMLDCVSFLSDLKIQLAKII